GGDRFMRRAATMEVPRIEDQAAIRARGTIDDLPADEHVADAAVRNELERDEQAFRGRAITQHAETADRLGERMALPHRAIELTRLEDVCHVPERRLISVDTGLAT